MKALPAFLLLLLCFDGTAALAADIYVSPQGKDTNPGTPAAPLQTFAAAQQAARRLAGREPVTVTFDDGTYYLPQTVVFTATDSGTATAPVVYRAAHERGAVLSGGVKLALTWKPYKDGIHQAQVPADLETEEIFINGERQILARYPNFNPAAKYFDGYSKDALSKERVSRWADPAGGYFHAMHPALWGDFTWLITGKDAQGEITKEGGWQNNRGGAVHNEIRFVENIFEELDAPGEWFLNRKTRTLYYYPPANLDLASATIEATRLRTLVEFSGDEKKPVRFVNLKGFAFRQAARTVMDTKEPLLRTDWAIYRGGAIFFNGAEDCSLEDALVDQVGGNAIFVNNYNRRVTIRGTEIRKAGASSVCFVGDQKAVRSALFNYDQSNKLEDIDLTPGPLTSNYPADCLVEDCLLTLSGRVEKQSAGVEIDIAQGITVRHCSIYDLPRSGINIGDGCFGGHVVEFCDIFDTVKETGDHGSFNSWGRDRFWHANIDVTNDWVKKLPQLPFLDVVKPITLRNNRWRCDHGWDVDLDDGSSNYEIYNNLMLHGGLKLREGYKRIVHNNVLVDNSLSPHVWYDDSDDVFTGNIVFRDRYNEARMFKGRPWGQEMNKNLVHSADNPTPVPATGLPRQSRRDAESIVANAQFIDPAKGDYRVKPESPALALGFKNFPMDQFGVQKPSLKAIARTPDLSRAGSQGSGRGAAPRIWLSARVRNIVGESEMSAFGTAGESGILALDVPVNTALAAAGLQTGDVIVAVNDQAVGEMTDLVRASVAFKPGQTVKLGVLRTQKTTAITVTLPKEFSVSKAPIVSAVADGSFTLLAADVEIVGTLASHGGNIENWKNPGDFLCWQLKVNTPGDYTVTLDYALDPHSDGTEFTLAAGGQTLSAKLAATGGWRDYRRVKLGVITLTKSDALLLTLTPAKKPGEAVMNLHRLTLSPIK
ncbi:MAG: PDZ domain-containing protein [Verrucomicrobia bacterium]|nr:PDZ domain-containing protein [Verrucomicrobiota bacterium]